MSVPGLPAEVGLALIVVAVTLAYLVLMRFLAGVIDDKFDPSHDWREAEKKAERMLQDILPSSEVRELNRHGYLEVPSRLHAGRVYRVPRYQGPIAVYEGGVLTNLLCVRSVEPLPNGDAVLLHKLMIEGNEDEYLRTANSIRPRPFSFRV
ncbi:MAG: hypothetical protein M0Z94_07945 [Dehalococcoidales bacterium]|nr:hypothetical protein [Dehalococcoidales bacterium]